VKKAALFLALAAAFLLLNRAAYQGYFQDDDLDNLGWTQFGPAVEYLKGVVTPQFFTNNFRPVGHFYFHEGALHFGLAFAKYVAVLHVVHLLNVCLLWRLLRRLGAREFAAGAACLVFGLHMALFDAFWKPAYVFDVLCGSFCLLSLLFWVERRWVLSFAAFWLAYKSKEVAVMLPVALAVYELWLGKRQWKPLLPFFAASLSFGGQALWMNPHRDDDYTFRFAGGALARTMAFYGSRVLLIPYAAVLLPLAAWRSRRAWFGLATMGIFLLPLLFLPGRMAGAYCYVPFIGLGIALSGIFESWPRAAVVAVLALWAPLDIHALREQRNVTLARDQQAKQWVTTLAGYRAANPEPEAFVYEDGPEGFARWGMEGAVKFIFHRLDPRLSAASEAAPAAASVAWLTWDAGHHRLDIVARKASY
jgi:hypothetical protein